MLEARPERPAPLPASTRRQVSSRRRSPSRHLTPHTQQSSGSLRFDGHSARAVSPRPSPPASPSSGSRPAAQYGS